ncbi:MAG: hypothetical protein ACEQSB_02770 [Undibacterium sp.]
MKFSMNKISLDGIRRRGLYVWIRHYKLLFVLIFLSLTGFVSYQWYQNLYRYAWTPEERKAYLNSTAKETAFQEDRFNSVLERLEEDREEHAESAELKYDLFKGARKKNQ